MKNFLSGWLILQNVKFIQNKATPIRITNPRLVLDGVSFITNAGKYTGGVLIDERPIKHTIKLKQDFASYYDEKDALEDFTSVEPSFDPNDYGYDSTSDPNDSDLHSPIATVDWHPAQLNITLPEQLEMNISMFRIKYLAYLTNVVFRDNSFSADQGGAVYVNNIEECKSMYINNPDPNVSFQDHNQVFFINSSNFTTTYLKSYFQNISPKYLRTPPMNITNEMHSADIYLGKELYITGKMNVTDYYGNEVECRAVPSLDFTTTTQCKVYIVWADGVEDKAIQLKAAVKIEESIQFKMYLTSPSPDCLKPLTRLTLNLACTADVHTAVDLTLRGCPLGYDLINHTANQVKCSVPDDSIIVHDDSKSHVACVEKNHWFGKMSIDGGIKYVSVTCESPYCDAKKKVCPIKGYTSTHQSLPWTQDEQCRGLRGGVMCRDCQEHAVFTFGASKCVPLTDCREWQPYLITCLAVVGQIVLSLVTICTGPKTKAGVGYLYGPLFFIAVYKLLPISHNYMLNTSPLELIFSFYETVLLLDLNVLGRINWCFFSNVNKTVLYSMRFLGPLITFLVLLAIVLIARNSFCYKFKINRIVQSPIQPMCLLMVLSFWSLSKTSIETIKPIIVNDEWRFAIQPDYPYMGNGYIIGLSCISLILLLFVYFPFIVLLFTSQFMRRKFNLIRIQPFLDAFQSSYKDKYQWFSAVYLTSWIILNVKLPSVVFISIMNGVCVLHFLIQPHKNIFLNITDTLLLADIATMSSLSYLCDQDHSVMIMKYPLLIIPLVYILLGGVWISIRGTVHKCRVAITEKLRSPSNNTESGMEEMVMPAGDDVVDSGDIDLHENIKPQNIIVIGREEESCLEREPLIYSDY